ncbi:MAG: GatB/YqeY domain-containing protein, partial [Sphingobacteriales bacterium]
MSLEQKVMDEMKQAMRAKDEAGLRTLRAIKAA